LIDTGQDKSYGRDLRKACETLGASPVAIVNTHSHADHYGGNDYLLRQYGIPVYAPSFEKSIIETPYLEPVYLFNGAKPLPELMSKWLLAKPSKVDHELQEGQLELAGLELKVLDTSGHAHKHMSLICNDVLIAADALFGSSVLEKYPLPFGQDIAKQIASAEFLQNLDVKTVIPGHGEPSDNLEAICNANLKVFEKAAHIILQACAGLSTEAVLKASCLALGINLSDLPRYFLNLCVVSAYLSYLRENKQVKLELRDNGLLWSHV
jgi:glyoxylase-like metal-dependent hydrolase (beta-lactamase superfamily II)